MYRRRRGAPLSEHGSSKNGSSERGSPDSAFSGVNFEKMRLRKQMRAVRLQLGLSAQDQASHALLTQALSSNWFASGMHVAAYWATGSELSLKPLLELLLARGVFVYLPHIQTGGAMQFLRYGGEAALAPGKYEILSPVLLEPDSDTASASVAPRLDVILLPLLAFDAQGHRLGQGGGYYDRYLQNLAATKPLRVGIAFHFQAVGSVPTESFDQKLHAVITDRGVIRCEACAKLALPQQEISTQR